MPERKSLPKRIKQSIKKSIQPVWKGPEEEGVTQSMLSRFLVCKERFRLLVIEGWKTNNGFSLPIEYGHMWHHCEEVLSVNGDWKSALKSYAIELCKKYPLEQSQVDIWFRVCQVQFQLYVEYWRDHKDNKSKVPISQEEVFCVPYQLPSGRIVKLRGKFDSVNAIGSGRNKRIWLQENKTKARIDEEYLKRQLTFDLQTMVYLIALQELGKTRGEKTQVAGVVYNVVKRTLLKQRGGRMVNAKGSDGRPVKLPDGSTLKVRQGEESNSDFAKRVEDSIRENPSEYFMRWQVEITNADINKFKSDFLDPCLEHLCLWYDLQVKKLPINIHEHCYLHYRLPYGIFNPIAEGRGSDLEEYMLSGSTVGLTKVTSLFEELI